ncbi:hypothetical protein ACQB60_10160 [Actinomycetota bacterium Odt1-20B]
MSIVATPAGSKIGDFTRIADRAFRVLALLVLTAGFAGLCSFLLPRDVSTTEFLRDARSGDVSVVDVVGSDSGDARVSWSTGFLQDKQLSYPVDALEPANKQFESDMRKELGAESGQISFRDRDKLGELGSLDLLVPVMYWRVMPYLAIPVLICCAVALIGMIFRTKHRATSVGYWLIASLVFGFGFPAYFWSEPYPLVRVRKKRAASDVPTLGGWGIAGSVVTWLLIGASVACVIALR